MSTGREPLALSFTRVKRVTAPIHWGERRPSVSRSNEAGVAWTAGDHFIAYRAHLVGMTSAAQLPGDLVRRLPMVEDDENLLLNRRPGTINESETLHRRPRRQAQRGQLGQAPRVTTCANAGVPSLRFHDLHQTAIPLWVAMAPASCK
jgi:hypothetical protein